MNIRPIINIRNQLSWHQRFYSDASTLALWSAWLWLCRPAILGVVGMAGVAFGLHHPTHGSAPTSALPSIEEMVLVLVGVASLLLLWNRLSREPAVRAQVDVLPDFSRHFGLSTEQIAEARDCQRCVVHHDDQGRIVAIETTRPVGPSFRAAA